MVDRPNIAATVIADKFITKSDVYNGILSALLAFVSSTFAQLTVQGASALPQDP
ncbi:MAG: hypothetical protein NVSMB49_28560 [Ktedonobacteraceae bacterium]